MSDFLWLYGALVSASIVFIFLFSRLRKKEGRNRIALTTEHYLKRFRRASHWGWRFTLGLAVGITVLFGSLIFFSEKEEQNLAPKTGARAPSPVVLVLVDVSGSMIGSKQVIPYEIYRMVVAKGLATGLIIYSDSAYIARYPTKDEDLALRLSIDEESFQGPLKPIITGTDTASAIFLARNFLLEFFPETPSVLVLISDLNDNNGLKIYTALSRFLDADLDSRLYVVRVGFESRNAREVVSLLGAFRELETKLGEASRLEDVLELASFFSDFPEDSGESFEEDSSNNTESRDTGSDARIFLVGTALAASVVAFLAGRELLIRKVD